MSAKRGRPPKPVEERPLLRPRGPSQNGTGPKLVLPEAAALSPATPAIVEAVRDGRGLFTKGNRAGAVVHRTAFLLGNVDPDYAPFLKAAMRHFRARCKELAAAHGGRISEGTRSILESEALALASSRYLAWKASQSGDESLLKSSVKLGTDARQNALAAWEMAARESKVAPPKTANAFWDRITGAEPEAEPTTEVVQ